MRAGGYALIVDGGTGKKIEFDTFTCKHCNDVIRILVGAPIEDMGGHCRQCDAPICKRCVADGRCIPFMKKLDIVEARGRLLASMGI